MRSLCAAVENREPPWATAEESLLRVDWVWKQNTSSWLASKANERFHSSVHYAFRETLEKTGKKYYLDLESDSLELFLIILFSALEFRTREKELK